MATKELRDVYQDKVVVVYAPWHRNDDVWNMYSYSNVRTPVPTWVFLTPHGKSICRQVGAFSIPEEGIALGRKVFALGTPTNSALDDKALPSCSKL
jgi:hypothetical protein